MSAKNETPVGELSDFDKRMAAEDPQYLARKAALEALKKHTDAWLSAYEFDDGENFTHSPTELESLLIADAFCGLTGDEEYMRLQSAWRGLCPGAAPVGDAADVARLTAERDTLAAQLKTIEDREALLAGSEESIPLKPASAHGLEGNAAAAHDQCRVMVALCMLLSIHYQCGAMAIEERGHPITVEDVGSSSAKFIELIGDHLNDCDGVDEDVADWVDPILDRAQEIWPGGVEAVDALAASAGDATMPVVAWQVRWTATPNEPGNANPWTVLTPAEYRPNPSRDEIELVLKPDAVAALAGRDVVIASLQKFNRDEHAAWDMQLGVISAEIARLTQCLAGANSQAEEFEREWYLRWHELEDLTAERDAAIAARDSAVKLVDSLNAQLAASRAPAAVDAATQAEREQCAKVCDKWANYYRSDDDGPDGRNYIGASDDERDGVESKRSAGAKVCADAIRAGGCFIPRQ